ncbi:MAG: cupin domain-containing protein [Candidatus Tectomicrobia bacterium]|nr:cupin domain-containing protein [Candidatus Tectomicrobia bacterium]
MEAAMAKTPQAYFQEVARYKTEPLWMRLAEVLTNEPPVRALPCLWRYADIRPLLLRAGELLTAAEAERRVLMLMNPGLEGEVAATQTLYAGLQLILPSEIAPTHRHSPAAFRFIVEGEGAYTSVNGERLIMHPGDLILTPAWAWHDHGNETDAPTVWLDGLDVPLVKGLGAVFAQPYAAGTHPVARPDNASLGLYGAGGMLPLGAAHDGPHSPLPIYPWKQARTALEQAGAPTTPHDGVIFEYVNPLTGGPIFPTMSAYVQMLRPGEQTRRHRHMSSHVMHVVSGSGVSIIGDARLEWRAKDTFAQPGWMWHEHRNLSASELAFLFSFSDRPVLERCGLYREEDRGPQG